MKLEPNPKMGKCPPLTSWQIQVIEAKGFRALLGGKSFSHTLPTLLLKAKDFAAELTSHNVVDKDLYGNEEISDEHVENNKEVRAILLKRGVQPETLPPAEDIKKVKRRLKNEETKVLETNNKKADDNLSLF